MILSGPGIIEEIKKGSIVIEPFDESRINPNSCDLLLGDMLLEYSRVQLFHGRHNDVLSHHLSPTGFILLPGKVYLGTTVEWTETYPPWIPAINGKSSIGRLGITVHITAGFGDCGFKGQWTLELSAVQPVLITPFIPICQIYYTKMVGDEKLYQGRYQNQVGPKEYKP